ncbi:MAG: ABC transporter permease [Patescibacteria group bacterium]|nr:ABC transporter permease [Patescibacteria group bacterium]
MLDQCKQCITTSITALLANKARSFLTMLGIIIGVGAVIVIMAAGAGAQSLILAQVKTLGTNLIGVLPGKSGEKEPPTSAMGIVITTLTYNDALALRKKKNVANIVEVVAYTKGVAAVNWKANTYDTNLSGCTAGYIEVEGGEVERGRFFSEDEERNMARVAVLGSTVEDELFGESEAVGQRIKIKKHTFEVIGVMEERGTVAFQDYDDQIFLPLKTMQKLIAGVNHLGLIRAKVDNQENIDQAIHDVGITLREQHNIADPSGDSDDFTIRNAAQALDMITIITDALRYFLAAMAAISLIVGGIGIMNIMLVNVTERTREIGLRKAVGANNFNILSQFLMEAVAVTLFGGIIGIISGAIISYIISVGAHFLGYDWDFIISFFSISLAVSVSMLVGLIFGLYPAWKASKLEPIEALRYE